MSAIIGPSGNSQYDAAIAKAHSERALNWAQLDKEYRMAAFKLHELALGEAPKDANELGPIYTRQALAMQREGLKLT